MNSASTNGIDVTDLRKNFDEVEALRGVSFAARSGSILGLLGPNGAGKTTAINILSTLLRPDGGTALVAGHDVVQEPHAVRQSISLTGQFAAVDDVLTGHENLVMFGRLRGLTSAEARARATSLLSEFSLSDAGAKRIGTYSGGMRRRLDIAVSLVVPTPVLFLDEPTTGLDPRSRTEVWDAVRRLRSSGRTIVLTTQYLEEADQLADSIVMIDRGQVVAEGTPSELKERVGTSACVISPRNPRMIEAAGKAIGMAGAAIDTDAGTITVPTSEPDEVRRILERLATADIAVRDISLRQPTLDEVFLDLTGAS